MRVFFFFVVIILLLPGRAVASDALKLVQAARAQIGVTVEYDPGYSRLSYPGGDVPVSRGVCTDVIIRAMRKLDVDLQKEVHEDMRAHFSRYPKNWGLSAPDRNIDHRRVPNLKTFFERKGLSIPVKLSASDYKPGDIVTWNLSSGVPHIGIVSDSLSANGVPLVIHNIGEGTKEEDVLFNYALTGHYRWFRN